VRILEDTERGTLQRKSEENVDKRADRPVLYLLGGQLRQFGTVFGRDGQQFGNQQERLSGTIHRLRKIRLELCDLLCIDVVRRQLCRLFDLLDYRKECTLAVIGRTLKAQQE